MRKTEQDEFQGYLDVDETTLDSQTAEAPSLIWRFGRCSARAVKEAKIAEAELKFLEADIDEEIRSNPTKYGLDKLTVVAVDRIIDRDPRYRKAKMKVISANYKADLYASAIEALQHRRTSIGHFVKLHEQSYIGVPPERKGGNGYKRKPLNSKRRGKE